MWQDLGAAFCLMLVIEGIMPFLNPRRWRNLVATIAVIDDKTLRLFGLFSMLLGTGLLYLIRG